MTCANIFFFSVFYITTMTHFFSKQFLKMAMQLKYAIKVIIVQSSNLLVVLEPYQLNLYI